MTTSELHHHHTASLDSVTLINDLVSRTRAENVTLGSHGDSIDEVEDRLERNKEHLNIQLAKNWFTGSLSSSDTTSINSAITSADSY